MCVCVCVCIHIEHKTGDAKPSNRMMFSKQYGDDGWLTIKRGDCTNQLLSALPFCKYPTTLGRVANISIIQVSSREGFTKKIRM